MRNTQTHAYTQAYAHMHARTHIHTPHADKHTYLRARAHAHSPTHTHTQTHAHTHTGAYAAGERAQEHDLLRQHAQRRSCRSGAARRRAACGSTHIRPAGRITRARTHTHLPSALQHATYCNTATVTAKYATAWRNGAARDHTKLQLSNRGRPVCARATWRYTHPDAHSHTRTLARAQTQARARTRTRTGAH